MVNDAGDRYLGHGDSDTRTADVDISAGEWVVPTSGGGLAVSDGGPAAGVASDDYSSGEDSATVWYRGVVKAVVDSGVTAGDQLYVGSSGTTGETAGVAYAGGSESVVALEDAADPDGDGVYHAYVLLR